MLIVPNTSIYKSFISKLSHVLPGGTAFRTLRVGGLTIQYMNVHIIPTFLLTCILYLLASKSRVSLVHFL